MTLELLGAWMLACVVWSSALSLCISEWTGVRTQVARQEMMAMAASAARTVEQDLHQATSVSTDANGVTATLAGGVQYQYVLNAAHQWVRVRRGGGSAVLAEGVSAVSATISGPGLVDIRLQFADGFESRLDVCTLAAMEWANGSS